MIWIDLQALLLLILKIEPSQKSKKRWGKMSPYEWMDSRKKLLKEPKFSHKGIVQCGKSKIYSLAEEIFRQNKITLFLVKTIVSRNFSYTTICSSHQALRYHHLKNISSNQLMHMQLFSRNFCHKIVKVKFRQFHNTVFLHNIIIFL